LLSRACRAPTLTYATSAVAGHLASYGLLGWRRAGRQARSGVTHEASAIANAASGPALLATQGLTGGREL
jgi:hypothetical protein